jgi:excisionase family DNA binding protein
MSESRTYTIAEAAALTGLHKNTIRNRVKGGTLTAEVRVGKFGEEYRLAHDALVAAGLLAGEYVAPGDANAEILGEEEGSGELLPTPHGNLAELFRRHEQAVYRLGWLEAELQRTKALAENAESLQNERVEREVELRDLKRELERAQTRAREADELRRMLLDLQQEAAGLRQEVETRRAAEAAAQAAASKRWWWLRAR